MPGTVERRIMTKKHLSVVSNDEEIRPPKPEELTVIAEKIVAELIEKGRAAKGDITPADLLKDSEEAIREAWDRTTGEMLRAEARKKRERRENAFVAARELLRAKQFGGVVADPAQVMRAAYVEAVFPPDAYMNVAYASGVRGWLISLMRRAHEAGSDTAEIQRHIDALHVLLKGVHGMEARNAPHADAMLYHRTIVPACEAFYPALMALSKKVRARTDTQDAKRRELMGRLVTMFCEKNPDAPVEEIRAAAGIVANRMQRDKLDMLHAARGILDGKISQIAQMKNADTEKEFAKAMLHARVRGISEENIREMIEKRKEAFARQAEEQSKKAFSSKPDGVVKKLTKSEVERERAAIRAKKGGKKSGKDAGKGKGNKRR